MRASILMSLIGQWEQAPVSELKYPLKSSEKGKRHKDNFTTETEIIITFPPNDWQILCQGS